MLMDTLEERDCCFQQCVWTEATKGETVLSEDGSVCSEAQSRNKM